MTNKTRIKKLEEKVGLSEDRTYCFLLLGHDIIGEAEGIVFYEKDDFKGLVTILEKYGKNFSRNIDSGSEEGQRILFEYGYQKINDNV